MAKKDEPYATEVSEQGGRIVFTFETSDGVWAFTAPAGELSGDAGP